MREILFRGKNFVTKEWVYGFYYRAKYYKTDEDLTDFITVPYPNEMYRGSDHTIVIPETVGQFTGLHDKNGNRIFDGDIIAGALFCFENPKNGIVTYRDGSFGLLWHRGDAEQFNPFTSMCNVTYEVIGNIHDSLNGGNNQ